MMKIPITSARLSGEETTPDESAVGISVTRRCGTGMQSDAAHCSAASRNRVPGRFAFTAIMVASVLLSSCAQIPTSSITMEGQLLVHNSWRAEFTGTNCVAKIIHYAKTKSQAYNVEVPVSWLYGQARRPREDLVAQCEALHMAITSAGFPQQAPVRFDMSCWFTIKAIRDKQWPRFLSHEQDRSAPSPSVDYAGPTWYVYRKRIWGERDLSIWPQLDDLAPLADPHQHSRGDVNVMARLIPRETEIRAGSYLTVDISLENNTEHTIVIPDIFHAPVMIAAVDVKTDGVILVQDGSRACDEVICPGWVLEPKATRSWVEKVLIGADSTHKRLPLPPGRFRLGIQDLGRYGYPTVQIGANAQFTVTAMKP